MDSDSIIKVFTTRVRQLILKVGELKEENTELYVMLDERDKQISDLNNRISQLNKDYNAMVTAKMLTLTDGDLDETKRRISKLITSVDKCITLLGNTNNGK